MTTVLNVNGIRHEVDIEDSVRLLDVLRDTLKLKGTRFGCGSGHCGACFVLIDGVAVASCDTPLWAAAGKAVTTVEGLGTEEHPHALQTAFIENQAAQCGYCTSGMLIGAAGLLKRCPHPDATQVRQALERNLCRCGTHNRVVRAVLRASEKVPLKVGAK
ncbi:MAG: oxidoreductase [Burkholderia sp.]|jgi:nicotinate dehydrogenase subunit A|nr:oxidoreductase [Burkholderia sp.]